MQGSLLTALILALFLAPTIVLAEDEDDNYTNYDSLVSQLEMQAEEPVPVTSDIDWEEVALHGGLGLIASYYNINQSAAGSTVSASGMMRGFQLHFGVNLFTRRARVEGVFRNYASESINNQYVVDLKEFEFRGIYLPPMSDKMKLRFGGGLAARYMTLNSEKASTPVAAFLVGFERSITPTVSFGPDLTYRSPLVSDTFDKASFDASLKMNATF